MKRARSVAWLTALAAGVALLLGYLALQSDADQAIAHDPRDKANHHPKHVE